MAPSRSVFFFNAINLADAFLPHQTSHVAFANFHPAISSLLCNVPFVNWHRTSF
jgi:hypothetical protein